VLQRCAAKKAFGHIFSSGQAASPPKSILTIALFNISVRHGNQTIFKRTSRFTT